jgi:hypothetical protein
MSDAGKAVFLSYARDDAAAARRIAEALRSSGIEVWFDENELRGGDAWYQKIRRQIKECAPFVPVISAHTQARGEGYFRFEWKLAVDRSYPPGLPPDGPRGTINPRAPSRTAAPPESTPQFRPTTVRRVRRAPPVPNHHS